MNPKQIKNFLDEKDFFELKSSAIEACNKFTDKRYYDHYGRFDDHFDIPEHIEFKIMEKFNSTYNLNNEVVFAQIIKYQKKDNMAPKLDWHKDALPCEITISFTIEKNMENWGLCVDANIFDDIENSAVIFDGRKSLHRRPSWPSKNNDDYLVILLIHTADKNFWANKINKQARNLVWDKMSPIDVKFNH